jgi:hypothetical protein
LNGKTRRKILNYIFLEKVHFKNGKAAELEFKTLIEILTKARRFLGGIKTKKSNISAGLLLPFLTEAATLMR